MPVPLILGAPPAHTNSCTIFMLRRISSSSNDCGRLRPFQIGSLDRPENFALGAQQDDSPTAAACSLAHALGELGWRFLGGAAGWHVLKITAARANGESIGTAGH